MKTYLLLLFFSFGVLALQAQLSEGGMPIELPPLKSKKASTFIELPSHLVPKKTLKAGQNGMLKSGKFAHSFEVDYTPANSGDLYEYANHRIWRLHVKSEGAKSLMLIFSEYHVPDKARLFIYNPEKTAILGAFTSKNNKPFKKLAVYPLPGDELILQYEEPLDADFQGQLEISKVNHDYLGVVSLKNSFERRLSGDCNIDINCEPDAGFGLQQRGVCRILADNEFGTATLMNNTAKDGRPMLLSAFHIYDDNETAQVTIYDFNYESPFCTGIDGYKNQSVSGATALASSDSLDFMLVDLSAMPPAAFRPYYVGWDATNTLPENTYTVHHPNGDTKKISHDEGQCDSITFARKFLVNGHWKVFNWEEGTTEAGSSGACLFNTEKRAVGTLSGGYASCSNNSYDAFSRLDKMWDEYAAPEKQIRYWLDPLNTGEKRIDGFDPYLESQENCTVISNFSIADTLVRIEEMVDTAVVTEVGERFSQLESALLSGVSIGIDHVETVSYNPEIIIRVYSGDDNPAFALKQFRFSMSEITEKAVNYFNFGEQVEVEGDFYISVVLANNEERISVYQSGMHKVAGNNTMFVSEMGLWTPFSEYAGSANGASLLMQVTICSASFVQDSDTINDKGDLLVYPNPANHYFIVEFNHHDGVNNLTVYDMAGKKIFKNGYSNCDFAEIDATQFKPGIYVVNVENNGINAHKRLIVTGQ